MPRDLHAPRPQVRVLFLRKKTHQIRKVSIFTLSLRLQRSCSTIIHFWRKIALFHFLDIVLIPLFSKLLLTDTFIFFKWKLKAAMTFSLPRYFHYLLTPFNPFLHPEVYWNFSLMFASKTLIEWFTVYSWRTNLVQDKALPDFQSGVIKFSQNFTN
mgnify:CR=1 FL=1